jgi:hypothetical protein
MAKKKSRGKDKPTPKPKSLRRQLRKAEAVLAKATAKRDKAQARVDAMSIIADELRAQLADVDKAADGSKPDEGSVDAEEQAAAKDDRTVGDSTGKPPGRTAAARTGNPRKRTVGAPRAASAARRSATATRKGPASEQGGKPAAEG